MAKKIREYHVPKIQLIRKKGSKNSFTKGSEVELYIDGKRIASATNFSLDIPATGLARVTVELLGNIEIGEEL